MWQPLRSSDYSNQLWDIYCVDAISTGSPTTQRSVTSEWRRIWNMVGCSVMVAELKMALGSSYHDRINGLWTETVTHCRCRDQTPTAVLAMLMIQCLTYSHRFHTETLILMKHWVCWPHAYGNTETWLCVCVCGVLPLPLPLHLRACLCHRAAVLPSVLAENQVLNALWLGSQLIPCSPTNSLSLRPLYA